MKSAELFLKEWPVDGTRTRLCRDSQHFGFYNDLKETAGLPKYPEVVQDSAICGLGCGSRIFLSSYNFPDEMSQENQEQQPSDATNPNDKIRRQLWGVDLLLIHTAQGYS